MSTTLYLKRFLNGASGLGAYFYASGFAPVGPAHAGDTHVVLGGDAGIQCTYNLGGAVLAWVSPPIATAITISGAVSAQAGGEQDGSGGCNTQLQFRLYKYSGGVEGSQFSAASMGQVLTIDPARYTWSDSAPTSTSFSVGDRIVIKFYFVNFILAMQTGGSTLYYGDETGSAVGQAFIQFTENILFSQEPEYVQGDNAAIVNPFTATGTSLAHDAMLVTMGVSHGAVVSSVNDGTNSYALVSQIAAGNTFDIVTYLAKNIAAGGPYSFTVSFISGSLITIGYAEYYGVSIDPLDQHSEGAGVSNTFDSGSKTTTQATEIIFGSAQENSGVNFTVGSGFVKRLPLVGGLAEMFVEDKLVTTTGSYNASGTLAGSDNWAAVMVTLKAATPAVVSTPTISPNGGNFYNSTSVTLSDADSGLPGFVMYYTTDGSTPTPVSNLYTGPFIITFNCTVQAVAIATGYSNSAIASATFTLTSGSGGAPIGSLDVIANTITQENILRHVVYRGTLQANAFNAIYPAGGIPLKAVFNAAFNPNGQLDYVKAWSRSGSGYIYSYVLSADKLMILQAPPSGSLVTATPLQQLGSVEDSMSGVFADRIIFEAGYLRNI